MKPCPCGQVLTARSAPARKLVPGLPPRLLTTTTSLPRLSAQAAGHVIVARANALAMLDTVALRANAPSAQMTATVMERARRLTSSPMTFPTMQTPALPQCSLLPRIAQMTVMNAQERRTRVRSTTVRGTPLARQDASVILDTAGQTARRRSALLEMMSLKAMVVPRGVLAVAVELVTTPLACASVTLASTVTAASL